MCNFKSTVDSANNIHGCKGQQVIVATKIMSKSTLQLTLVNKTPVNKTHRLIRPFFLSIK